VNQGSSPNPTFFGSHPTRTHTFSLCLRGESPGADLSEEEVTLSHYLIIIAIITPLAALRIIKQLIADRVQLIHFYHHEHLHGIDQ